MIISMIVAVDGCNGIARLGQIPWHLPEDLKIFRLRTMGHFVVVGRKTWESFKSPLTGRHVVVMTNNVSYVPEKTPYKVVNGIEEAVTTAEGHNEKELFIIGGAEIYKLFLNRAQRVYLTRVWGNYNCDTFFPVLYPSNWDIRTDMDTYVDNIPMDNFGIFTYEKHLK